MGGPDAPLCRIRPAVEADVPLILALIRELAEYERMAGEVTATEADLRQALFGPAPSAEAVIAVVDDRPAGFALFFHNFSTFTGKRGLYLEDLFVRPEHRRRGIGRHLPASRIARERGSRSSGPCSTGTSWRFGPIGGPARCRWTTGRSIV